MGLMILIIVLIFFFKQKTAYEMRISDLSSDVCSSDLWRKADIVLLQHVAPVSTLLLSKGAAQGISHGWPIGLPELSIRELPIQPHHSEIGRASCRERVCQYV